MHPIFPFCLFLISVYTACHVFSVLFLLDIALNFAQKTHCLWMKWNMMFDGTKCFYQVIFSRHVTDCFITNRGSICNSSYINFLKGLLFEICVFHPLPINHSLRHFSFVSPSLAIPPLSLIHLTYVYIASIYCVFSFVKCWYISLLWPLSGEGGRLSARLICVVFILWWASLHEQSQNSQNTQTQTETRRVRETEGRPFLLYFC